MPEQNITRYPLAGTVVPSGRRYFMGWFRVSDMPKPEASMSASVELYSSIQSE